MQLLAFAFAVGASAIYAGIDTATHHAIEVLSAELEDVSELFEGNAPVPADHRRLGKSSGGGGSEVTAWKATSSCPWVCKQGWWWESSAFGKPACCQETRGSPYDNCEHEQCSCDASCRSCCD
jgi:hypothetical protein